MNKTTNYQLNQWERTDKVQMEDFNADNAKIDAALGGLAETLTGKGDCSIEIGSYVGDAVKGKVMSITAAFPPKLVIIYGGTMTGILFRGMERMILINNSYNYAINVTWEGNTVSWTGGANYGAEMLNGGETYYYAVFG